MTKWVYGFGDGGAEGCADRKNLLGGKGAGLAEMSHLGLPVSPGFAITTEACNYFYARQILSGELREQVECALVEIERTPDARFGDPDNPLLVSVRSGARVSMPGMMDTVLNLGLNLAKPTRKIAMSILARSSQFRPCGDRKCKFVVNLPNNVLRASWRRINVR